MAVFQIPPKTKKTQKQKNILGGVPFGFPFEPNLGGFRARRAACSARLCSVSSSNVLQLWSLKDPKAGVRCGRLEALRSDLRLKAGASASGLGLGPRGGFIFYLGGGG